jgi:hypothetical protein
MRGDARHEAVQFGGMDTDDLISDLAWTLIRDWRRRRDIDPAVRWAKVRLYIGVIGGRAGRFIERLLATKPAARFSPPNCAKRLPIMLRRNIFHSEGSELPPLRCCVKLWLSAANVIGTSREQQG